MPHGKVRGKGEMHLDNGNAMMKNARKITKGTEKFKIMQILLTN